LINRRPFFGHFPFNTKALRKFHTRVVACNPNFSSRLPFPPSPIGLQTHAQGCEGFRMISFISNEIDTIHFMVRI
jgi:hypothetical protein